MCIDLLRTSLPCSTSMQRIAVSCAYTGMHTRRHIDIYIVNNSSCIECVNICVYVILNMLHNIVFKQIIYTHGHSATIGESEFR